MKKIFIEEKIYLIKYLFRVFRVYVLFSENYWLFRWILGEGLEGKVVFKGGGIGVLRN